MGEDKIAQDVELMAINVFHAQLQGETKGIGLHLELYQKEVWRDVQPNKLFGEKSSRA